MSRDIYKISVINEFRKKKIPQVGFKLHNFHTIKLLILNNFTNIFYFHKILKEKNA